ncbi:MAG: endonuclease/exonuclease/phosphatase family protein [Pseudomonadota bacterium]
MNSPFRIVAWNIRAGGGQRAVEIAEALIALEPQAVVLSEFRSTAPSQFIAKALAQNGLTSQQDTCGEVPSGKNGLLVAARGPIKRLSLRRRPTEPGRWCIVRLEDPRLAIGGMHIPNQHTGRKPGFHDAVVDLAQRWRGGHAVLLGDTNSGQIGIDEETPVFNRRTHHWFESLGQAGWIDGFRHLNPETRSYTWYSHRDNGFRLDQAFVNRSLRPHLKSVEHIWLGATDRRRDALSDHAALVADFGPI